jgi:REP-associated tyrosine transposase
MARANRHFIPGHVWHITHRCHKREFLLKFAKDRHRWRQWLYQARKRYGLKVLNYVVTSNHIHLLVYDSEGEGVIQKSMQLIAGRTAQEYNNRKNRKGAFWEDRYHATAIEKGDHLLRSMVYIDLNMVRTGIVSHPGEWIDSGYVEIQSPRRKCILIDYKSLGYLAGFENTKISKRLIENG